MIENHEKFNGMIGNLKDLTKGIYKRVKQLNKSAKKMKT